MSILRVVLADDDARLRSALHLLIDDDPAMEVVAEAADGVEAVDAIRNLRPDVALLDVRMPRMTGLEVATLLGREHNPSRVILLTTFDLDEYVYEALCAGASGFLLKNTPPGELLRAIRVVADGNALLAPEVTRRLIGRFARERTRMDERLSPLTQREREALTLIGQGASNDQIAGELYVTPTTARTYVSRILAKLGARDRAQLVVIAYESGLVRPTIE